MNDNNVETEVESNPEGMSKNISDPIQKPAAKQYGASEEVVNELLAKLTKLPWADANPLILLIQQNFKLVEC